MKIISRIKYFAPSPVKRLIKRFIAFFSWDPWANYSWSQEGEDQILRRIFDKKNNGFYIDIGAHHPKRFSNTFLFYKLGWTGINIDAMPGSMIPFSKARCRDINVEVGIGQNECQLDYFIFNEPALNGFSKELSDERHDPNLGYQIEKVIKVNVFPLSVVLDRYLPNGQEIDFMSVDVEGLDFEVLKSNDWVRYRPKFVLAEVLSSSLHEIEKSNIGQLMTDAGYAVYAKSVNTVFFRAEDQK